MNKLKVVSLILVMAMLFGMVGHGENLSEQEIASKLYQIGLVSGDGSGLNLNGELTRAEAATFIVKLIGREKTVLNSPSFYGMTPFTDIKGDEWYAPFVGYCAMNKIISGYPDNTFRANEKLTEKAFLTMILKSLQYTSDDFSWDNVFLTAYNKGLVKDLSYAVRVEDADLDRGATLSLMYNALNLYYKDNSKTLLDNLMTNGVVTMSKAESLGLVKKDKTKTIIESATATGINQITVKFNETIESMTSNQISLKLGSTNYTISDVTLSDNKIVVETNANLNSDDYTITIVNVTDKEGFVIQSLKSDVEAFEAPEVNSDYFRIKKVESISKNRLNVYFTQPVNINAASVSYYSIMKNGQTIAFGNHSDLEVAVLGESDDAIGLYLKNVTFEENELYTLKISSHLTSAYDVSINDGKEMTSDFLGDDSSNKSLKIDSAVAIANDTVRLTFNQDIDLNLAINISNYYLKNISDNTNSAVLSVATKSSGNNKNRVLDLKVLDMDANDKYELTVLSARDIFKMSTLSNEKELFSAGSYSSSEVKLDHVIPMSTTKLHLYFDKPLSPAAIAANITGVDDVLIVYNKNENYKLTVYLDKDNPIKDNKTYTLKITSGIIDLDGQVKSGTLIKSFVGTNDKEPLIEIDDARFIGEGKVKITFETEIAVSNGASQYKLQYENDLGHDVSITADSVNYLDPKTVIASFSNVPEENYKVVLYNITDPANQNTTQLIETNVTKEQP